jgi:hypothetical protein
MSLFLGVRCVECTTSLIAIAFAIAFAIAVRLRFDFVSISVQLRCDCFSIAIALRCDYGCVARSDCVEIVIAIALRL